MKSERATVTRAAAAVAEILAEVYRTATGREVPDDWHVLAPCPYGGAGRIAIYADGSSVAVD